MSYPTWSDLSNPSIVPPLGARQAPDIGPAAVLVSTAPDIRTIASTQGNFTSKAFFTSTLMTRGHGGISVAGPYIGAPYAVMLLESLIAKGARQVVVLGWCGAIDPELSAGDLIVPTQAICDEGTSRHYARLDPDLPVTRPDKELTGQLVSHLGSAGLTAHETPIWSTDAIYRETRGKVDWFHDQGAMAVEMECSALFAAAAFRQVPITALLVVSDSLVADRNGWTPGFKSKSFKTMRRQACALVLDVAESLCHDL